MKSQKELKKLLQKYISGHISASEETILHNNITANSELNEIIKYHDRLMNPENKFNTPENSSFQIMRKSTINKLYSHRKKRITFKLSTIIESLIMPFRIPAFSFIFAIVMLISGFIIGNFNSSDNLISNISHSAQQSYDLQSSTDAPYFYSNAQFKELENGTMEVNFDVSRHIILTSQKSDPLIQDILAQSLVSTNNMSDRLRYISKSEQIIHPKIKEALISTMLKDKHHIVRQKSMSSLLQYAPDENLHQAFFTVLKNEQSVYMRLAAIDYLSENYTGENQINSELRGYNYNKNSTVKKLSN